MELGKSNRWRDLKKNNYHNLCVGHLNENESRDWSFINSSPKRKGGGRSQTRNL